MSEDGFCPLCGVVLDLHDGPDTCTSAAMKADTFRAFERAFFNLAPTRSSQDAADER